MKNPLRILGMAVVALAGLLTTVTIAPTAHAATTTIVSLTFDDGPADQAALPSLLPAGMPATMFVNSGRIGLDGYLTWQQLTDLHNNNGYEIGGHTVSHADLPTLSTAEQQRQVCDDRSALLSHGFPARSFAYPYGDDNAMTMDIVKNCGYNNARTVGGLASSGSCGGCPSTNAVPPSNTYEVWTPDSIKNTATLSDLENLVTGAETHGGGWLPLVFHHLCAGSSCPVYSVDPSVLQQFAAWLAARASSGTVVQAFGDVIGGDVQPAVAGPPAPAPTAGSNMLQNPSLETASSGSTPDCWTLGGFGNNTRNWSRVTDAHTGSFAERVDVTNYSDGDAKLVNKQDLGQCAPAVTPGHSYVVSGWYQSDAQPRLVAYYRTSGGGWQWYAQSAPLPASAGWTSASMTVNAPDGASALSVGLSIRSNGFLAMDDFSLVDTDHPTVTLTAPADGSTVKGLTSVSANASAPSGISKAELLVDGAVVGTTTTAPYTFAWDSTSHPDGTAALAVRATDGHGNVATSPSITVTVANNPPGAGGGGTTTPDTAAPSLKVYSIPVGTIASSIRLAWFGSDAGSGIASYDVRYRRAAYNAGFRPWTYPKAWQGAKAGSVKLPLAAGYDYCAQVRARDAAGNVSGWSTARCVARALDDRALAASKGWTRGKARGFYAGTYTATKQRGAALARTGGRIDRIGLVATRCKSCGTVAVYVGKKLIAKVQLTSSKTRKAQLIMLPRFSYRTGTITIKVLTSGKTVQIDGLVASRT